MVQFFTSVNKESIASGDESCEHGILRVNIQGLPSHTLKTTKMGMASRKGTKMGARLN